MAYPGKRLTLGFTLAFFAATGTWVLAQQSSSSKDVPDAPSATKPTHPPTFPANTKPATAAQPSRPEPEAKPAEGQPPVQTEAAPAQPPSIRPGEDSGVDAFRIGVSVNFVTVPVSVKDKDGHLVEGLERKDFNVYEDGVPQDLKLFTSDPFPLSAAVVVDQGMSDTAMRKVNQTVGAITGAFSQYDEVSLYTYGNTVQTVSDFRAANEHFAETMRSARRPGRSGGVPVTSGPLAGTSPSINGKSVDIMQPHVTSPSRISRVLNDALLRAALDLSKRERARRRIIFLISDGKEDGSKASYSEVLKVLLTNEVVVYAIGVDSAALPLYERVSRIKLVGQATGNILPKYAYATGGELFTSFTRDEIEKTYARLTTEARNQYTLGYTTKATASTSYRSIEVRVKRPGLKVIARDGYYPLPRSQPGMNAPPSNQ